jgi:hypothetical protein
LWGLGVWQAGRTPLEEAREHKKGAWEEVVELLDKHEGGKGSLSL